jgi:hypothetical protein
MSSGEVDDFLARLSGLENRAERLDHKMANSAILLHKNNRDDDGVAFELRIKNMSNAKRWVLLCTRLPSLCLIGWRPSRAALSF